MHYRFVAAKRPQSRRAVPILIVFAVILLGIGIYQSTFIAHLETTGLRAQGEVVRLKEEYNNGHYNYFAIVRCRAANNMTVQFKDEFGSNPRCVPQDVCR